MAKRVQYPTWLRITAGASLLTALLGLIGTVAGLDGAPVFAALGFLNIAVWGHEAERIRSGQLNG